MLDEAANRVVAFGCNRDDTTGTRRDFLDIRKRFFVAQLRCGIRLVACSEDDDRQRLVDERVGAVLHLAGWVTLRVDVGDFLELQCTFEGNGKMNAAPEVKEVAHMGEAVGELLALRGARFENIFDLGGNTTQFLEELYR